MESVDMEEDNIQSPRLHSNIEFKDPLSTKESIANELTSPEKTLANEIFASPASSEKSVELKSSQVLVSPTKLLEEDEEDVNETESANKSDAESNIDDSSSSSEEENEENEDETPEDAEVEGKIVNKVVAAEIEAVKEIERGPTEAELRRMKLIEL